MFHASKERYEQPCYASCHENRTNHENGNLGLWFSTDASWIKGFGSNTYQFNLDSVSETRNYDLLFKDLALWNHQGFQAEDYQEKRLELIAKGYDFIRIIESNGRFDMGIVLNFDAILNFSLIAEKQIEPHSRKHEYATHDGPGC